MIRREVRLADGAAGWMLISQIEHARISGELAARCVGCFGLSFDQAGPPPVPADIRDEVLAAIVHHDDGWAEWERAPRLDPTLGRPLAFTEIQPAEAIAIWGASIAAAELIGSLAAWMVAGHFLRLARKSDAARADPLLSTWQGEMERRRDKWLNNWRESNPAARTIAVADAAFQWLWSFDEASLWLCCACSSTDHGIPCAPEPCRVGRGTPVEMDLQVAGTERAAAEPWRFADAEVGIAAAGWVVPARRYADPVELLLTAAPKILRWRLSSRPNPTETPLPARS